MSSRVFCNPVVRALGRSNRRDSLVVALGILFAVMAGAGIGLMADLATAAGALVQTDRVFEPRAEAAARAERRYAIWREMYGALRPINHALVG